MRRFVLGDPISLEDVPRAREALGWNIGAPVATDVSSETPIRSRDGERAFLFIEDRLIAAKYFGWTYSRCRPMPRRSSSTSRSSDHEALAEIIGAADTSEAALDALSAACASANESFDPLIFEFVKRSMGSSEPRSSAVRLHRRDLRRLARARRPIVALGGARRRRAGAACGAARAARAQRRELARSGDRRATRKQGT